MLLSMRKTPLRKGTFDEFVRLSKEGVAPFYILMGTRPLGYWQIVPGPGESELQYDGLIMITEYVDMEHWAATRPPTSPAFRPDPRSAPYNWDCPAGQKCLAYMAERAKLVLRKSEGGPPSEHYFLKPGYSSRGLPWVFRDQGWIEG